MFKPLNFIKELNQILLFIAALLFIVMISKEIVSDLFPRKYEPPKVELVDNSNSNNIDKKQTYKIDLLTNLKDVHIFQLSSEIIDTSQSHANASYMMVAQAKSSHSGYLSDNAVNLMFVKENGYKRMLLEKDGLISEFTKTRHVINEQTLKLDKNVYLIITEDTNKNGYLDQKDRAKLYVSSYDGEGLTHVLSDVLSYEIIDDNRLIITQTGEVSQFYLLNISDLSVSKLNTKIENARK